MRIISGIHKGKKIIGESTKRTRPTKDRVKESLFAIINQNLKESTFLDLFGGYGSLSFEAISNGAKKGYIVDNNPTIIKTINQNIENMNIKNLKVLNQDYQKAITYFKKNNLKFDIIFLDPPYAFNNINKLLNEIEEILYKDAIIIYEHETPTIFDEKYSEIKHKKYGNTLLSILKKNN